MTINNLIESFLFSDVYQDVENIINKSLLRKNGYLLLEQKELDKINSFIKQSIWFKFLNSSEFNYERIIKKIMILEEKDLLKIHKKKLIIKKSIPYGNIRDEFRKNTFNLNIKEIVYKYFKILLKSDTKEILNIYKFIEFDFDNSFKNKQLTSKLIYFYSIKIFLYSILYIEESKNFNFKLNNKVLDLNFINFISKTFVSINDKQKELINFNKIFDLKKEELEELKTRYKQIKESLINQNKILFNLKDNLKTIRLKYDSKRNNFYSPKNFNSKEKETFINDLKTIEIEEVDLMDKIEHLENIINSNTFNLNNFNKNKNFLEIEIHNNLKKINLNNAFIKQSFRMINYKLQIFFNNN